MRFLLVDNITEWRAGEMIKGTKNVAMSEDFLEYHFPGNPIMPGVLLLEAMVQLTGWLEAVSSDFDKWFLIRNVRRCKFYGFAMPGDQVSLEVERKEGGGAPVYSGVGIVNGKKKLMAEYEGDLISFSDIENVEEQKNFFKLLTREAGL